MGTRSKEQATIVTLRTRLRRMYRSKLQQKLVGLLVVGGIIAYAGYMAHAEKDVDPKSYQPLLTVIGAAESNDNYNAYFGNANNTSLRFTDMTIAAVQQWQREYIQQGNASSAVGRYQIINTTLNSLVSELRIDTKQPFSPEMQDRLAIALLERRGAVHYASSKIGREEFAANLAKEWAGLPRIIGENPTASYYDGDGLNKSRAQIGDALHAIGMIQLKDSVR